MRIKRSMLLTVILGAALVFSGVRPETQAQQSQDYQAIADRFFVLLEQGKSDEAIDYMFSTNVALKNLPGKSEQLKAQFADLESQLGSYHSHTRLAETKIAWHVCLSALFRCLRSPAHFCQAEILQTSRHLEGLRSPIRY